MRWIVLLVCLWCCPVSFANDDTEEQPGWCARPRACSSCPGGKCKVSRPRPRPTR